MPTKNKRINLTVPEPLYEKILAFREENGIASDASACIQLISAQLRGQENMKVMLQAMQQYSPDQLMQLTKEGYDALREEGLLSSKD